jgi:hypothetical protein
MPKDWKEIPDDEILNFEDAHTAKMARYERIMQKKSIDSVHGLRDKLVGLMDTIYRASQGLKDKTDQLIQLYGGISRLQGRQQNILIGLSIIVAISTAVYTWITWQSVTAIREANEIQRQFLEFEKLRSGTQKTSNKAHKPGARITSPSTNELGR